LSDDGELIKAGTEGLVEGTLKSFHELILRLFGPAADEAGLILTSFTLLLVRQAGTAESPRHMRRSAS
jgi:hypothetical protein